MRRFFCLTGVLTLMFSGLITATQAGENPRNLTPTINRCLGLEPIAELGATHLRHQPMSANTEVAHIDSGISIEQCLSLLMIVCALGCITLAATGIVLRYNKAVSSKDETWYRTNHLTSH